MGFSDQLLEEGQDIWEAQLSHPFVTEMAEGTLDEDAFLHWVKQDYQYLLDYVRVFALAGLKADDRETMSYLLAASNRILEQEADLHREFASNYGISPDELETIEKTPTCVGYTNFLVRTAYEGSFAEISAAVYPCGQGYLDVAEQMAKVSNEEHRYTPFIEKYTSEEYREAVMWMRDLVDRCAERYPGERETMREAFLTSARFELAFWEMAYTQEQWNI